MKLIDNWRQWPRMYSQWAFATILGLQGSVLAFLSSDQLAAPLLPWLTLTWGQAIQSLTAALAVSGFVGRLISQSIDEPAPTEPAP
jgi:hypothetical protein